GLDLPFDVAAAVRFTGQANFHILKYLHALAKLIDGGGSFVFENSNATGIRGGRGGQPGRVKTAHGSVMARSVVVATKVPAAPLAARFTYGSAEYPTTSYLVAGKYTGRLKGMYISPDPGQYSLLPIGSGRERLLLIGGENHIPGLGRPLRRHRKLAAYGQERFGIDRFEYRWKAMDYLAYDGLPLAGRLYPHSRNTYAISGLKKWGLNLSMVAAIVIRDLITGQPQPAADLFDPHRGSAPRAIPKAIAGYLADRLG
ncbi:MAG TPA: FAD-dependent oxidoreductase, partial [Candidatus Saccharimonadales bacterium]|nr:FAD-dependent oxidoreductase [Candidatus Saccharimonadales bacterium]